ncbi:MAG TPA: metal-dependent hydrolase [Bauldia sp.]|nr:metal-dependent hydrolase [Bauldia sp.]
MKLTWFGHAAFRMEIAGAVIMIDPFLANPTFKGDQKTAWKGATHVVLTHGHGDHVGSAVEICKAGALLIAAPEVCDYLGTQGVTHASIQNHGGEVDYGAFRVAYVPAWHSSSDTVDGKPVYLGNPAGVVIMARGEKTLHHMGDTGISAEMALTGEIYDPKIGLVPVGDRVTMGGRTASIACKRFFRFETVIPMHYGTFGILQPTADAFIDGMKGEKTKVVIPERGQPMEL